MIRFPVNDSSFTDVYPQMYPGKKCRCVTFIVTHDCSLSCSYCYENHKSKSSMPFDIAKRCVDMLFDEDRKNSRYINPDKFDGIILDFIGGEPLLEIELIDKIMDYFIEKALTLNHRWAIKHVISMSSNGVDYFNPKATQFLEKHVGRVSINITIDGNRELHDMCRLFPDGRPSYDLAAAAFRDAIKRFNQSGTKMTIAQANLPYLFQACKDMILEFDLSYLQGNTIFEDKWTTDDANLYYNQLKQLADWMIESGRWEHTWLSFFEDFIGKPLPNTETQNWCGGTGEMLAFDIDGSCYPCLRYSPVAVNQQMAEKFVLGHCDTGLEATEAQQDCVTCLGRITRQSQSEQECLDCPIASGCAWCSAWNCEMFGTPDKRCVHICPMHYARVAATSYFYNTIYRKYGEPNRFDFNVPKEKGVEILGQEEYEYLLKLAAM